MDYCPANYKSMPEDVDGVTCESSKETPDCAVSKDSHGSDSGNIALGKCLLKCGTFPCPGLGVPPTERGGKVGEVTRHGVDAKSSDLNCSHSISLPDSLRLVPAIKGGREKQGRKLTVSWAPDVYDPIPTAVSHVPNTGQSHKRSKKRNSKNKQKNTGKSSRGNKGKDKKQSRKQGGSSQLNSHTPGDGNTTVSSTEVQPSIVEFDIGSPDSFCGSSFLKNSTTKLHFPVAEAS